MTKTKAVIVPVTPFQQNCTLLWCEVTKRAVVIDPGGDHASELVGAWADTYKNFGVVNVSRRANANASQSRSEQT